MKLGFRVVVGLIVQGGLVQYALAAGELSMAQLRLSSFMDGRLLEDKHALVRHSSSPPKAASRTALEMTWVSQSATGWGVGAFLEDNAWINGRAPSVEVLGAVNSQSLGVRDVRYPFQATFQSYRRWGLTVSHQWQFDRDQELAQFRVVAKGMAVDRFKSVTAEGVLTDSTSGTVGLQANSVKNELGRESEFLTPEKILGFGLGWDLEADWKASDRANLRISVQDVGAGVRLPHVLREATTVNTQNVTYDANEYINYAPMVSGQYEAVAARVKIKPKVAVSGRWDQGRGITALAGLQTQYPFTQVYLGGEWAGESAKLTSLIYGGAAGLPMSLALQGAFRGLTLGWRGDALSPARARIWGLTAAVKF